MSIAQKKNLHRYKAITAMKGLQYNQINENIYPKGQEGVVNKAAKNVSWSHILQPLFASDK